MRELRVARSELILGGDAAAKTARAQALADAWLAQGEGRRVVYIATAQAWDAEMRGLVDAHRRGQDRPGMVTVEEPTELAHALGSGSRPDTLIVVDCLTLWLTHWLMPMQGEAHDAPVDALCAALPNLPGPVVLVSNEIGLGVIPMGREVRGFVDALGSLNQRAAQFFQCAVFNLAHAFFRNP